MRAVKRGTGRAYAAVSKILSICVTTSCEPERRSMVIIGGGAV